MTTLARQAAGLLGGTLASSQPFAGGDLSQVIRVTLRDGRAAIVKGGPAPRTEAAMLAALAATGAPTPAVLAVSDSALVLEQVAGSSGIGDAWASLGAALARLHRAAGPGYGWDTSYAFGKVAIDNSWAQSWPVFWVERRIMAHAPHVPPALAHRLETLARDLPNRLPEAPAPSLLHGDLWGGNVMAAEARVTGLIDPACYYGHAEVDIAMLGLFDRPGPALFDHYGALTSGAQQRMIIYRLWPALVHLRLFGSGYAGLVENLLCASGV